MADYLTTDTELTSIANAIRAKSGATGELTYPADFITAIANIPSAVVISDALDAAGGTIRTITATDSFTAKTSSDLTANGDTVSVPAGYYAENASKSVASGTAGTPVGTKSAVSSNALYITPSVTNTAGYISSGTIEGDPVIVQASELVSGTKSITANGTNIDVANYQYVTVNVSSGGGGTLAYGTFTAQSTAGIQTINITYSGSGYPIAVFIFPDGGFLNNSTWRNITMVNAIGLWGMTKGYQSSTPTYATSGTQNQGVVFTIYKSSSSSATSYGTNYGTSINTFTSSSPVSSDRTRAAVFSGNKALKVYTSGSSGTISGFQSGVKYKYIVVYSA